MRHLYMHLHTNRRILPISTDPALLVPFAPEALRDKIASGDPTWQDAVPALVRDRNLARRPSQ